jgi:hypothetical protein
MNCTHTWIINAPSGPVSDGVCETCGDKKQFNNSAEFDSWYGVNRPPVLSKEDRNLANISLKETKQREFHAAAQAAGNGGSWK